MYNRKVKNNCENMKEMISVITQSIELNHVINL